MPTTPVTVEQFTGLRLRPEVGETTGAVSMLNVDLKRDYTQIATRGGLDELVAPGSNAHRIGPSYTTGKILRCVTSGPNVVLSQYSTAGGFQTVVGSFTATRATSVVRASGEVWIAARDGSSNTLTQRYSGALLGTRPWNPRYYAYMQDGRLAQAHYTAAADTPSGADGTVSTIFFSDPDASQTYGATNWVQVGAEDGEEITGMVAWRDLLFVIKRSNLFVFYSTSIDATGNPIFNYRQVTLPARARATTNMGGENLIAANDGVYLLLSDGVYRTTGDIPQLMSANIAPLFNGTGDTSMLFPATGDWTIGYGVNRIFLSYAVGAAYRTLVFDTQMQEWLLWDLSAGDAVLPTNVIGDLDPDGSPQTYVESAGSVFEFTETSTSDGGTAIVSSYQAGFDGLGAPTQEKKVRDLEVVGSGSPTLTVLTDYVTTDPLSRQGTVTLGTAPAIDTAVHPKAYRGRLFSYKLSASSGAWAATRLTWNVQSVRRPGMRSS